MPNIKRQECLVFSRVCGWLVPRNGMNRGKIAERNQMVPYSVEKIKEKLNDK